MRLPRVALASILFAAACGSTGAPAPVIDSFTASPATIGKGGSSTLAWSLHGASQIALDHGFGVVAGASVTVMPTETTTYTLTAVGAGGTTRAQVTVTVTAQALPRIISFTATPPSVGRGHSTTLTWGTTDAASFALTPDVGAFSGSQATVTPAQTTTYTLTATGPGGTAMAQLTVNVHDPILHLEYTDPALTASGMRLVKSASSTDTRVVLDLMVATLPVSAYGAAMNLPFDVNRATLSAQGGFSPNASAIDPGSSPTTAAAMVPTAGPLQGALVLGLARKKRYASDGEVLLPAGTRLLSIAFDLVPNAAPGVVFDGVTPGKRFDAALLKADGTRAVDKAGFAIGQLIATF